MRLENGKMAFFGIDVDLPQTAVSMGVLRCF